MTGPPARPQCIGRERAVGGWAVKPAATAQHPCRRRRSRSMLGHGTMRCRVNSPKIQARSSSCAMGIGAACLCGLLTFLPCSAQLAGASTPAEGGRRNGTFCRGDPHGGRGLVVGLLSAAGVASAGRAATGPDRARLGGIGGRERRTARTPPGAGRAGRRPRAVELWVGTFALGQDQRRASDDGEGGSRESGRDKSASCVHDEHPCERCMLPTRTSCPGNHPAAG
jgi:hypothetical protein